MAGTKYSKTARGIGLFAIFLAILLSSCALDLGKIEPGEMKFIPHTSNYAIGTDSTIVIINRETGKTLNVIKRHYKTK